MRCETCDQKMAEEQHELGFERIVPQGYDWPSLLELKGEALEAHYIGILNHLGGNEPPTPWHHRRRDRRGDRELMTGHAVPW